MDAFLDTFSQALKLEEIDQADHYRENQYDRESDNEDVGLDGSEFFGAMFGCHISPLNLAFQLKVELSGAAIGIVFVCQMDHPCSG